MTKPLAAQTTVKAELQSPVPGSQLVSDTVTLSWTDTSDEPYYYRVGSSHGHYNYDAGWVSGNSVEVSQLPHNGETVHVTLFTKIGSSHQANYYEFTAATLSNPNAAEITEPAPGTTLESQSHVFMWDNMGTNYRLTIGKAPRGTDYANVETDTAVAIPTQLPTDGRTLYVSIYTEHNGVWLVNDYIYTAADLNSVPSEIVEPVPGSTLGGDKITFRWDQAATNQYLTVGDNTNDRRYFEGYVSGKSKLIEGLPMDGRPIVVGLYSYDGSWTLKTYQYTAGTPTVLLSPVPYSALSSSDVQLRWEGATTYRYVVKIGSEPGMSDYYGSGNEKWADGIDFENVTGLPTNGETLYVTIVGQAQVAGEWTSARFELTAANSSVDGSLPYTPNNETITTSQFLSDSREFSDVTYNRASKHLIIVGDEGKFFEYETDDDLVPIQSTLKTYNISVATDPEGVAWMYDNVYAILNEDDGKIHVVDMDDPLNETVITKTYQTISTSIPETNNSDGERKWGAEGVAFEFGSATAANPDNPIFYVVKEKVDTKLYKFGVDSQIGEPIEIDGMKDLSGVYYSEVNDSLYIVSDDSQEVTQVNSFNWGAGTAVQSANNIMKLPSTFAQAEGITFSPDLSKMIIVSETKESSETSFGVFTP